MKNILILITLINITSLTYAWDFTEVSSKIGLSYSHNLDESVKVGEPQMIASGLAIGDINGDGWDDIFVVTGESLNSEGVNLNPNKLFIAQKDGTFLDQSEAYQLDNNDIQSSGPLILDINNDGTRDLIFGSVGTSPELILYKNESNFKMNKTENSFPAINGFSISSADYDKDGDLDLFISRWLQDTGNVFWQNDGLGNFIDITPTHINAKSYRSSFTPLFVDINNDNWVDILLTSDFSASKYFINNQTGFMLEQDSTNIDDENGMGAAIGDYDNDGDFDWFVTAIFDDDGNAEGGWGVSGNRLYNNDGTGNFQDVSHQARVNDGQWGWGACFADFNNDMYLDIFHVNGFPTLMASEPDFENDQSKLFINNKNGTFTEMSTKLNLIDTDMGRSIICYDNDRDGDIDILVGNNRSQSKFFQNNLDNDNNYINIKLVQDNINIDAVGAKIELKTGDVTQLRQVVSGGNFASSVPNAQHFGLEDNTIIDSIKITWPDDSIQELVNVSVNQYLVINKQFSIAGNIKDNVSNTGISQIKVKVFSEDLQNVKTAYTDFEGNYSVNNLVPGKYYITTESVNFINQAYPNNKCGIEICNPALSSLIELTKESVSSVDFALSSSENYYPKLSGLWYNNEQSGHGMHVEILQQNDRPAIYVSWYAHLNGNPIWLTGVGSLNKGIGAIDLYITSGTSFPPNFDTESVENIIWGTMDLNFTDLNNGIVEWNTEHPGFQSGDLLIQRLTHLSNNIKDSEVIDACQSGTYFNSDQSGHGVMLEVLGENADSMVITWFTYNNQDEQLWLLATGEINGDSASLDAIYTNNTSFPPDFNNMDVNTINWGAIDINKVDDDNITMSWQPNDLHSSYDAGTIEFSRLTRIKGEEGLDSCAN